MQRFACAILASTILCAGSLGADEFDFLAFGPYRDDVAAPASYLGYEIGTLHTHHFRMQDYFEELAEAAPERISLHPYGESWEKKQLFYAVISSEENMARIEEIRRGNLALADPRETPTADAASLAATLPVVVWLDYGNDGNETANIEAAMQVAFQLVAGESEEMQRFRSEAVIIVEPDHNPESHDRHVAWYNAFGVGDSNPGAMEHDAPWGMSTNNNHYQIDLNRDAWPMAQPETQALAVEVLRWRPQVFADHHGQTENYFFAPPVDPINASLPQSHHEWYEVFGQGNARAFDTFGWQYYVRDVFDLFYPGYWDSWPALHGAIGMTYETDAGGSLGLAYRKRDGHIATFLGGIAKHFTASLATVRTAVENKQPLMEDFHAFFATGMENGRAGRPYRAFVLDATRDPRRSAALVATLMRHGIEVQRLTEGVTATATRIDQDATESVEFPAGSYLIDMAQPDQRAADTYLSPDAPMDPEFVERQYAKWARNARRGADARKERYEFYDITSWSLPMAFGVDAWSLPQLPSASTKPVETAGDLASMGTWVDEIPFEVPGLGGGVSENVATLGAESSTQARSSYLFTAETDGALRLAGALLDEGFRLSSALRPLAVGERDFPRGTFVAHVVRNAETLHDRIEALARECDVEVFASDTAFPMQGQTGTGSNAVVALRKPRVAMLADEGVRITEYGAAWFTLEQRLGYPFTPVRIDGLGRIGLDAYDVLIVPHGSASTYREALGEDGLERLGDWLRDGGTIVGWGTGAMSLVSRAEWVEIDYNEPEAQSDEEKAERIEEIDALADSDEPGPQVVSPSANPDAPLYVPGTVARADLDLTHWLTIGFDRSELPILVRAFRFPQLSARGDNPVVFADESRLHVSGFFWPGNSERWLSGTPFVRIDRVGRGQVVLFAHDPNFRLAWRATSRLFGNAVLLGPSLGILGPGRY